MCAVKNSRFYSLFTRRRCLYARRMKTRGDIKGRKRSRDRSRRVYVYKLYYTIYDQTRRESGDARARAQTFLSRFLSSPDEISPTNVRISVNPNSDLFEITLAAATVYHIGLENFVHSTIAVAVRGRVGSPARTGRKPVGFRNPDRVLQQVILSSGKHGTEK